MVDVVLVLMFAGHADWRPTAGSGSTCGSGDTTYFSKVGSQTWSGLKLGRVPFMPLICSKYICML